MKKRIVFNGKRFVIDPTKDKVISSSAEARKGMFFTFFHPFREKGKTKGGVVYEYNLLITGDIQIIPKEYIEF